MSRAHPSSTASASKQKAGSPVCCRGVVDRSPLLAAKQAPEVVEEIDREIKESARERGPGVEVSGEPRRNAERGEGTLM